MCITCVVYHIFSSAVNLSETAQIKEVWSQNWSLSGTEEKHLAKEPQGRLLIMILLETTRMFLIFTNFSNTKMLSERERQRRVILSFGSYLICCCFLCNFWLLPFNFLIFFAIRIWRTVGFKIGLVVIFFGSYLICCCFLCNFWVLPFNFLMFFCFQFLAYCWLLNWFSCYTFINLYAWHLISWCFAFFF